MDKWLLKSKQYSAGDENENRTHADDVSLEQNAPNKQGDGLPLKRKSDSITCHIPAKLKYYCKFNSSIGNKFPWIRKSIKTITDVNMLSKGLSSDNYLAN